MPEKTRDEIVAEMMAKMAAADNGYMNEVATPGCATKHVDAEDVEK